MSLSLSLNACVLVCLENIHGYPQFPRQNGSPKLIVVLIPKTSQIKPGNFRANVDSYGCFAIYGYWMLLVIPYMGSTAIQSAQLQGEPSTAEPRC